MPDPNAVIQAALAWRDAITSPPNAWADREDFALIAAVDTYRGGADRTSIDQFLLAVHFCDDCRINANAARNRLASGPGSVPRASTPPAENAPDGSGHTHPRTHPRSAAYGDPGPVGGALPEISDEAIEAAARAGYLADWRDESEPSWENLPTADAVSYHDYARILLAAARPYLVAQTLRPLTDLAGRLNQPMVKRLRACAIDTSPSWDDAFMVYPHGARGLVELIDALLVAGLFAGTGTPTEGQDRG